MKLPKNSAFMLAALLSILKSSATSIEEEKNDPNSSLSHFTLDVVKTQLEAQVDTFLAEEWCEGLIEAADLEYVEVDREHIKALMFLCGAEVSDLK